MQYINAHFVEDMSWELIAATYGVDVEEVQRRTAIGLRRMSEALGGLPSKQCSNSCECREVAQ
jgi:DNA-directed RNA polymerase specialized sigma24 family protein